MLALYSVIYPTPSDCQETLPVDNQTPAKLTKAFLFLYTPSSERLEKSSRNIPHPTRSITVDFKHRGFQKTKLSSHQSWTRQFCGHRHIYDGHLGVSGVGFSHAVTGAAAGGNHRFDLHSFTTFHRAERKILLLIVRFDFKEEQPAGMTADREKQRSAHEFGSCDTFKMTSKLIIDRSLASSLLGNFRAVPIEWYYSFLQFNYVSLAKEDWRS